MTNIAISKSKNDSNMPQRRHFIDVEQHEAQKTLLKNDITEMGNSLPFKRDPDHKITLSQPPNLCPTERKSLKRFQYGYVDNMLKKLETDIAAVGDGFSPEIHQVNKMLYVSTYQANYDHLKTETKDLSRKKEVGKSNVNSLYQSSFDNQNILNNSILNPEKGSHGKRNLLENESKANESNPSMFKSKTKTNYKTSYQHDFKQTNETSKSIEIFPETRASILRKAFQNI